MHRIREAESTAPFAERSAGGSVCGQKMQPLPEGAPGCKCVQRLCMLPASGVPIAGKTVGQLSRREGVMKGCRKSFFDTPVRPNAAGRGVFISRFWNRRRARRARAGRAAA